MKFKYLKSVADNSPEAEFIIILLIILFINFFINRFTLGIIVGLVIKDRLINISEKFNMKYDLWDDKVLEKFKKEMQDSF